MSTFTISWCYVFYVRLWEKHCLSDFCWMGSFLETLFRKLNLKPSEGYLLKKMSHLFVKTGHGMTDMVINCTEFKF